MWTTLHIFLKTKKTSVFKWVNSYEVVTTDGEVFLTIW